MSARGVCNSLPNISVLAWCYSTCSLSCVCAEHSVWPGLGLRCTVWEHLYASIHTRWWTWNHSGPNCLLRQVSCCFEVNQKTRTISFWKVNVFMMSENSTFTWWHKHYVCVEELHARGAHRHWKQQSGMCESLRSWIKCHPVWKVYLISVTVLCI